MDVDNSVTFGLNSEPNEEGKGFEFENGIVGGVVPREYIPAVQAGLKIQLKMVFLLDIH